MSRTEFDNVRENISIKYEKNVKKILTLVV